MDLAVVHAALITEIKDGLSYVLEPARMAELGDIFDTLSFQFEALGLCHLFEFADQDTFRENLMRSGHGRRYFLRRSHSEKNDADRHLALSGNPGFLDAVVAGALPLACDIARLSTPIWNGNWEYEDDFCFRLLLHQIALDPGAFPTPDAHALLARFEKSLEGGKSVHFDVAKALVAKDPAAFAGALGALVAAEAKKIAKDRVSAAVQEGDLVYWPRSRASIEGLALLNLTRLLNLPVEGEFPLCPPLARLPWKDQPADDLFEEIERLG
jgi:hypothetical protein